MSTAILRKSRKVLDGPTRREAAGGHGRLSFATADADLSPCSLVTIEPEYFLSGLWGKSLLVCAHAGQGTESHVPIEMHARSELVAAIVTLR
jgi:hypothetical protein